MLAIRHLLHQHYDDICPATPTSG